MQIGFTTDRDPTGTEPKIFAECNRQAHGKWKIEPLYMPPTVDAKREQIVRRLAGKDPSLDIISLDVVLTAEFAEAGWIYDLTNRIEPIKDQFIPSTLSTVVWKNKYWALPVGANAAMLFYRTDLIKSPPKTWEDMVTQAKAVQAKTHQSGFLWQANEYEGMTVDSMEFILAAGGQILSPDGKTALIDKGDGVLHAFQFMRSLVKDGVSPTETLTFQEEESRQAFQQGKAPFLRNWPYVFPLANAPGSSVRGKFAATTLPGFAGHKPAGVLGGVNYAVSKYSDNPQYAWEAAQCIGSAENDKLKMIGKGELSTRKVTYDDPEVIAKVPFTKIAFDALQTAASRPITPHYNDVSYAINHVAHEVTAGNITPEQGVKELQRKVQLAIDGKGEI